MTIITFLIGISFYLCVFLICKILVARVLSISTAFVNLVSYVLSIFIISYLYYFRTVFNLTIQTSLAFAVLLEILFLLNLKRIKKQEILSTSNLIVNKWVLLTVFILTCHFFIYFGKYGGWDAITMWNLKAKFLFSASQFPNLFNGRSTYLSPDYPLMLPSIVGYFWTIINSYNSFVPMLLAYSIMIIIPMVIYYALNNFEQKRYAYIGLFILVVDTGYKTLAGNMEADLLFSLNILLVFILVNAQKTHTDNLVYLISFLCASGAWIKNEGIAFFVVFTIGFLFVNRKNASILKKYILGMIIPLIIVLSFKGYYSYNNVIFSSNTGHPAELVNKIFDIKRYLLVLKFLVDLLFKEFSVILLFLLILIIINKKQLISFPFLVMGALLTCYFCIYIIAPGDLNWLVGTSMARLIMHIYPSFIYLTLTNLPSIKQQILPQLEN